VVDISSTGPGALHAGSDPSRRGQLCRPIDLHANERSGEADTNNGPEGRKQKSKQELARYAALSVAVFRRAAGAAALQQT